MPPHPTFPASQIVELVPDFQAVIGAATEDAAAGRPPLSHSERRLRFLNTSWVVDYW